MDLTHPKYAKSLVQARVLLATQGLEHAEDALKALSDSLDTKDIRQSDFAADADLDEHLLVLRDMIGSLMESTAVGGPLCEHFERELA